MDTRTGQRTSLGTADEDEARQIVHAKNQAERQPLLNFELARAYLSGSDSATATRTWSEVMVEFLQTKTGPSRERYERQGAETPRQNWKQRSVPPKTFRRAFAGSALRFCASALWGKVHVGHRDAPKALGTRGVEAT